MKIAVTSTGDNLESVIDPRFGRCSYFAIYDSDSENISFLVNPAKDCESGAGPAAVSFIAKQNVKKIISGEFGFKINGILKDLNIETLSVQGAKSVIDIINEIETK